MALLQPAVIAEKQKKMDTFYKVKGENPDLMIKDVDMQSRTISGLYNAYYFLDSDRDVLITGAAAKSINDRGPDSQAAAKIKHALFHDLTKLPGKIIVLKEAEIEFNGRKVKGIYFETKMSETEDGTDTLIKYQEGIYDNHSIGFRYLQLDYIDVESESWNMMVDMLINPEEATKYGYMYLVKEINLFEGSTVAFGANSLTPYLGVKSIEDKALVQMKLFERMDRLNKQLTTGTVSDNAMKTFELQILQIKQMMSELFETAPFVKPTANAEQPDGNDSVVKIYSIDEVIAKI